jgi:hypothetical protein
MCTKQQGRSTYIIESKHLEHTACRSSVPVCDVAVKNVSIRTSVTTKHVAEIRNL